MRYEIAPGLDAPSVVSAVVPGRDAGDGRTVFSYLMPVKDLPPGQYYLRATLSQGSASGTPLKRVARTFRVVSPPAPAPSPATSRAVLPPAPVPAPSLARPFRRDDAVQGDTLQRFRDLVAPSAREDFDAGVASLGAGEFTKAEQSFKAAQRASLASGDSTAPLTYLAATYAASGHDLEATNVWQTALIDGSEYPEIYVWLSDSLIRTRNYEEARSILREALGKWPADTRLTERIGALPPPP
jgi:tetratricopeptide (TPR) repeat protein